jgi:hypothetical protein
VTFARYIDGKGIHAGLLYTDGVQQSGRRVFGLYRQGGKSQHKQQHNDSFHAFRLLFCVERNVNKPSRRAGQDVAWAYILCPVLASLYSITQNDDILIYIVTKYTYIYHDRRKYNKKLLRYIIDTSLKDILVSKNINECYQVL